MKKLLFYIDSMQIGGANRVMANLTEHFSGQSTEVILVNDIVPDIRVSEYNIPENVKRYFLDAESAVHISKNIDRIRSLRRIIKSESPDIVLSFMGPPNVRMLISSIGLKTKKITSVRNDPNVEYGTGIKKLVFRTIMKLADGVVFQTQDAAEYFPNAIQKRSRIIFNPVNEKFYQSAWNPGGTEIVVVGRLQPQKNPMNVLKAFEKIAGQVPAYTLGFYGDGELRSAMEKYIDDHGLNDRVSIYGRTDEVDKVLSNAALYVLCSDYEGMPNALMEAMAVGVPVISTDCPCGGPRALIKDTGQGVLIPCNNSDVLADEILKLLLDEQRRVEMSVAARKRAQHFKPEQILNEWNEYFLFVKNS